MTEPSRLDGLNSLILDAEAKAAARDLPGARLAYETALADLMQHGSRPAQVRALTGLSWVLCTAGRPDEALQRATQALEIQAAADATALASIAIIQSFAGHALMALGRYGEALGQYVNALDAKRRSGAPAADRASTLNLLGEAAGRFGRFDLAETYQADALKCLRAVLPADNREIAVALTNLGVSLYRNDKAAAAESALREALQIDPSLLLATENLIHVLYKQDRKAEGRALAEQKYRAQSFVVHRAPPQCLGTLLLLWSLDGTVPHHHLLAGLPMRLVDWHIEYADEAQEALLPAYGLVLNLIGDTDQGGAALDAAMRFQARCPVRMLNDPARIRHTGRDEIATHLAGVDNVVIPRVACLRGDAFAVPEPAAWLTEQGFPVPVLLRDAGMHGGESVCLYTDDAALEDACRAMPHDGETYVTAFYDYRSPDGFFRKYRAIFIDRKPYPYHLAISPQWLVHYFSADMIGNAWKQAEEMRYLQDMEAVLGPLAMQALHAIGRRMDLDYCGIDFSLLPDGRVLLFECNATMLVHPEAPDGPLAAKNAAVARIIGDFQDLLVRRMTEELGEMCHPPKHPVVNEVWRYQSDAA